MDRAELYRYFAEKYGWPPEVVSKMTPAQMQMYAEDAGTDKRTGKATRRFKTVAEAEAFMRGER